jgi:hypothetical protein
MPKREREPKQKPGANEARPDTQPAEPESDTTQLQQAIRALLDALDRCAGDPPDCPHCGPARALALDLIGAAEDQVKPKPEQERVQLSGRVGADPTFRTTPKGTLIGRFPLAVRNADDSTTWFPVLAFNQRAERLKDVVERGAPVNVVGYVHEREGRTRDGKPRMVQEVYAVTVTRPGTK